MRAFGMGITSNLLNPKVIILYVSFVPQFVPAGPAAPARTACSPGCSSRSPWCGGCSTSWQSAAYTAG